MSHDRRNTLVQGLAGILLLTGLYLTSLYNYLLFHTLAELISVVIAGGIFVIAWNARRLLSSHYLLLIGIAYLFVGVLDLLHALAYRGMPVFTGFTADLPTQLWIAARYLQSLSLLAAPLFLRRILKPALVLFGYAAAVALLFLSIFVWRIFPVCLVEGAGLTAFKKVSEYIICLLLLAAIGLLVTNRGELDRRVLRLMVASIAITVVSELAFTAYLSVYDFFNLMGHNLKIVAFIFVYKAIVETGFSRPYELLFRQLKRSEEHYRSLFDQMIDGFAYHRIVVDGQGQPVDYVFLEVNSAFERLTGLRRENLLGRRATEVLPGIERDTADWIGAYGRVALTGEALRFENRSEYLDRWYSVLAYSPEPGYFAVVFEEITERQRIARELQQARLAAEEASRAKSEFLAHMSHEIRTPLSAIIGLSEVLLPRLSAEEPRQFVSLIRESARSLLAIVGDILDLSRAESGKVEVRPEPLDLRETVEKVIAPFRVLAGEKGLRLEFRVDGEVPRYLRGDPDLLGQVLRNLVSNAIKYTERGFVRLRVGRNGPRQEKAELLFEVSDSGIGIPAERQPRLFQSFSRLHSTVRESSPGGTGLGLAISRRLVELMGGRIGVESAPGKGSIFSVLLPLEEVDPEAPVAGRTVERDLGLLARLPPMNILLAEDNPVNRLFLQRALEDGGHRVTLAENGREAVERVRGGAFDLILMDVQMPVMDGLEAARTIRALSPVAARVPIIAVTAFAIKGDRQRFLDAGMDGYVSKPVRFDRLVEAIRRVCPVEPLNR